MYSHCGSFLITLCLGSIEIDCFISELYYKGGNSQKNYKKITMLRQFHKEISGKLQSGGNFTKELQETYKVGAISQNNYRKLTMWGQFHKGITGKITMWGQFHKGITGKLQCGGNFTKELQENYNMGAILQKNYRKIAL